MPKLNEFPDIYDVQIYTVVCINYRSVNVGRERKASANKGFGLYILEQGRTHRLIHVKGLFKVVMIFFIIY